MSLVNTERVHPTATDADLELAGVRFKVVESVASVACDLGNEHLSIPHWYVYHSDQPGTGLGFALETVYDEAFAHWVLESVIYLPAYLELRTQVPGLKLLVKRMKGYKRQLFHVFGITDDDLAIVGKQVYRRVYLPSIYSLNDQQLDLASYRGLVDRLYQEFHRRSGTGLDPPEQWFGNSLDYHGQTLLYMPRNRTGNYPGNDRRLLDQDAIVEHVHRLGGYVLYTDQLTDFRDQVAVVRRAKCLVLNYGSSLWVNGLMVRDARILVLNYMTQHLDFPSFRLFYEMMVEHGCTIEFYPATEIVRTQPVQEFHVDLKKLTQRLTETVSSDQHDVE